MHKDDEEDQRGGCSSLSFLTGEHRSLDVRKRNKLEEVEMMDDRSPIESKVGVRKAVQLGLIQRGLLAPEDLLDGRVFLQLLHDVIDRRHVHGLELELEDVLIVSLVECEGLDLQLGFAEEVA